MSEESEKAILKDIRDELYKLNRKIDELEDSEKKTDDRNILEKYPREVQTKFWKKVKEAGNDGLTKREIGEIFGVEETRAYEIQNKLASQIGRIIYDKQAGNKPGLTKHEKYYLADVIAEENKVSREEVLKKVRKASESSNKDEYEILKKEYENLEDEKTRRKRDFQKTGVKGIL